MFYGRESVLLIQFWYLFPGPSFENEILNVIFFIILIKLQNEQS